MLKYSIEFKEFSLLVKIEEQGTKRVLYLDTLKAVAKEADQEALALLTRIHLRSPNASLSSDLSFQSIEVSGAQVSETLKALAKTERLFFQGKKLACEWETAAKVYWKGEKGGALGAFLHYKNEEIPIEQCERIFPGWFLKDALLRQIATPISWRWVEIFSKGPLFLEGIQKKKFLEEEPPILWKELPKEKPIEVLPELHLRDATGCFADLWMDYGIGRVAFEDFAPSVQGKPRQKEVEKHWEKDLLESGFIRKRMDNSHYYCPSEKIREALFFLIEMGWKIIDFRKRRVFKQSGFALEIQEENGAIAVRGTVQFQSETSPLRNAQGRMWVDLNEESVGLLDRKEQIEGEWEGETLYLRKQRASALCGLLDMPGIQWEDSLRKAIVGLKNGASMETAPPGPTFQGELLPYQQKGVDWLAFLHRWGFSALLADEMGLGKTVQVLAFFSRLRTNLPVLIVAPTSLTFNWRAEIDRFLGISVYVHTGPERLTELSELQKTPWIITSYAILRLDEELLSQVEFEVIALDESNAIKTASTQIARAACRLKGRFKIAISGTPMENRVDELWSQFRFLMPDLLAERLEPIDQIKKKIRPFLLRRRKEEVQLDLPEKIEQIAWVEMGEGQLQVYDSYRAALKSGLLKQVQQDGMQAHRMEVLEAILRLRQICCDPRLVGSEIEGAKLELLMADLEEALSEQRKVLIYSQFTSMLQLIGKEVRKRGWDPLYLDGSTKGDARGQLVRSFQEDPEKRLFLLSLKAGGVGLNLTAADYVLLFDPWWNEAVERQAIDRAHRIGQKKTVIAKRYLIPNTIEEKMLKLKAQKQLASEQLLDIDAETFNWTEEDLLHLLL